MIADITLLASTSLIDAKCVRCKSHENKMTQEKEQCGLTQMSHTFVSGGPCSNAPHLNTASVQSCVFPV